MQQRSCKASAQAACRQLLGSCKAGTFMADSLPSWSLERIRHFLKIYQRLVLLFRVVAHPGLLPRRMALVEAERALERWATDEDSLEGQGAVIWRTAQV